MERDCCVLTERDRYVLEKMRGDGRPEAWLALLRRKFSGARPLDAGAVPPDVATIDARVSFRCGGGRADVRTLCLPGSYTPGGGFLSISSLYGLALLGLREGQSLVIERPDGRREWIVLEKVHFQPNVMKQRPTMPRCAGSWMVRLSVGRQDGRAFGAANENSGCDDPGPPAA